jgi:hypothetical protein
MADPTRALITGKVRSIDGKLLEGRVIATSDAMFVDGGWVTPVTAADATIEDGVIALLFTPGDVSATISFRDLRAGDDRVRIAPFHVKLSAGQEVDLADLLPAQVDSGRTIVVDPTTADRAEAAAARAEAAADHAESGGGLTVPEIRERVLEPHIDSSTPHPAYDELPSLALLFENGIAE